MLRFDDQFPLHRKVQTLSDSAFRLHVEAIFWTRRNTTDGFLAKDVIGVVSQVRRPAGPAAELVQQDAWHRIVDGTVLAPEDGAEAGCAECAQRYEHARDEGNPAIKRDGWIIHGFADWQETRSKVLQLKEQRAKAGKLGGKRSGESRRTGQKRSSGGKPKQPRSNREATRLSDASPPNPPPPTEGGRASPRRADARGAAAAPPAPPPAQVEAGDVVASSTPRKSAPPAETLADVRQRLAEAAGKRRAADQRRADPLAELGAAAGQQPDTPAVACPDCGVDLDPDGVCRHRSCARHGTTVHPIAA